MAIITRLISLFIKLYLLYKNKKRAVPCIAYRNCPYYEILLSN